ncbi:MAG: hypothetical protein HND52_14795 [Ignavibacteriae bacterium]|nr:hypothetical protein [Ignavibacteriota bacterium]NOG99222.1 hypothetical protein [Ignavibacteriota bacterium]
MNLARYFLFSASLLLLASSCSRTILEISTLEDDKEYYNGNEVVGKADSSALVFVEYVGQNSFEYVFYVQIENLSDRTYLYTADNNHLKTYHTKKALDNNEHNNHTSAVDPEKKLEKINSNITARNTNHAISTGCNCLGGLFSAVSSINSDEEENDVIDWIESQEAENIDYENDMNKLHYEREFWKTEVLRRNTLHPGDVIGGLVFFNKDFYARYFKVFINVNSAKFKFLYQQKKVKRIAKAK